MKNRGRKLKVRTCWDRYSKNVMARINIELLACPEKLKHIELPCWPPRRYVPDFPLYTPYRTKQYREEPTYKWYDPRGWFNG